MTGIWRKTMMGWCGGVAVFGAVLAGAGHAATDAPAWALFRLLAGSVPVPDPAVRFSVGLMGAVTLGWGLALLAVASVSHRLDPATGHRLWRRLALALGVWYVVDGTISVITGFGLNAVSNTVLLATFLLIAWRGRFLGPGGATTRG